MFTVFSSNVATKLAVKETISYGTPVYLDVPVSIRDDVLEDNDGSAVLLRREQNVRHVELNQLGAKE